MYYLVLLYIVIIIFQVLYTYYFNNKVETDYDIENSEWFIKNYKTVDNYLKDYLKKYSDLINNKTMTYDEWIKYIKENPEIYNFNDYFTFSVYQKVPNTRNDVILLNSRKPSYLHYELDTMLWTDALQARTSNKLDSETYINEKTPITMINLAKLNDIQYLTYFNVDPHTKKTVLRKQWYTKWQSTDGKEGAISIGYVLNNITDNSKYRYIDLVHKPELIFTSILIFILSVVIFQIKSFDKSHLKSFLILITLNAYLTMFINTKENITSSKNEINKNNTISSNILGISFLTGVSIFIMNFIYKKHVKLFIETACIFGVSILLLLTALFKSTNQNYVDEVIGARITNQLVFNVAVFLNGLIIFNFVFYTFVISKLKHFLPFYK